MPKPQKKKRYHHGDLRRALIEAALAEIAVVGPERFTLREAARRVGVSPGAPYRHFPDKEALLAAVAAECVERLGAVIDAAVAEAEDSPLARFRATGVAYVRFAVENPAHFRVMNLPGLVARTPLHAEVGSWKAGERERLAAAQRDGHLGESPLDLIMLASHCLVHGLAHLIVDGESDLAKLDPARAAELAFAITGVFGAGLIPRQALPRGVQAPASATENSPQTSSGKKLHGKL